MAKHKCMCGAIIKIPHTGDCHFGWHNPDTCPKLNCPKYHNDNDWGNKITAEEKKEVEDMIFGEIEKIISTSISSVDATERLILYLHSIGYRAND